MTTIKEKIEKNIEAQLKKVEIEKNKLRILESLPKCILESLDEDSLVISEHVAFSDMSVYCKAESLNDAILIAEKANPISVFKVSSSCTSFRPDKFIKESEKDKSESICPYFYEVKSFYFQEKRSLEQKHFLNFFFELEGVVIHVMVRIEKPEANLLFTYEKKKGRIITTCELKEDSGHFLKRVRFYATDGQPNNFICYA